MKLIETLIQKGWLKTPEIISAFQKIRRVDFMPDEIKNLADSDEALPIGYGQTISQPLVVAFMIEQLQPKSGDKILDIGSGSGWTSALLGEIVGENGKVFAIELIPELKEFGEKNAAKYNFIKKGIVEFICADACSGLQEKAPFNGILCSASAREKIPSAWKGQLSIGGRIVAPLGSSIFVLEKRGIKDFKKTNYPGFVFVPLVSKRTQ